MEVAGLLNRPRDGPSGEAWRMSSLQTLLQIPLWPVKPPSKVLSSLHAFWEPHFPSLLVAHFPSKASPMPPSSPCPKAQLASDPGPLLQNKPFFLQSPRGGNGCQGPPAHWASWMMRCPPPSESGKSKRGTELIVSLAQMKNLGLPSTPPSFVWRKPESFRDQEEIANIFWVLGLPHSFISLQTPPLQGKFRGLHLAAALTEGSVNKNASLLGWHREICSMRWALAHAHSWLLRPWANPFT